jgi:hypothetical protein
MKLVDIRKVEDCFDGSMIFRYSFNKEVEESLMRILGQKGKLHYYPKFLRPFFKIMTGEDVQIKGIIGDDNFEVVYPQTNKLEKKREFEANLRKILEELEKEEITHSER